MRATEVYAMTSHLDHLIAPSRDRVAAARLLGTLLDVPWSRQGAVGPFSPVFVNDSLTIDCDQWPEPLPRQHYCFRIEVRPRCGGDHRLDRGYGGCDGRVRQDVARARMTRAVTPTRSRSRAILPQWRKADHHRLGGER